MFAGKTSELLRLVTRAEMANKRVILYKYANDKRYSESKVSTHDFVMHEAISCDKLMPRIDEAKEYDIVGIDEGQFFADIVEFAKELAKEHTEVIIAALDGDFLRRPFGSTIELISCSESVQKLTALTRPEGKSAAFSKRCIKSDQLELIGGSESYMAATRSDMISTSTQGEIRLILGPVNSQKTSELTKVMNDYHVIGKKIYFVRNTEKKNMNRRVDYAIVKIDELPPVDSLLEYDVIGVDDAHEFPNIATWCDDLANKGKIVYASALSGNEEHVAYRNIIELFPKIEGLKFYTSVCEKTGGDAPFFIKENGLVHTYSREALSSD